MIMLVLIISDNDCFHWGFHFQCTVLTYTIAGGTGHYLMYGCYDYRLLCMFVVHILLGWVHQYSVDTDSPPAPTLTGYSLWVYQYREIPYLTVFPFFIHIIAYTLQLFTFVSCL